MKDFRVNKDTNTNPGNYHEVHAEDCEHYDQLSDYEYLGNFSKCQVALVKARLIGYRADGCKKCCPDCHEGL